MKDGLNDIVDALTRRTADQPLSALYAAERIASLESLITHLERELPQVISEALHEAAIASGGDRAMLLELQNSTLFIAYASDPSLLGRTMPWVRALPDARTEPLALHLPARALEALEFTDAVAHRMTCAGRQWLLVVGTTHGTIDRTLYANVAAATHRLFGALLIKREGNASRESNVDHLTGLPDRWATMRRISEAAANAARTGAQAAVLFIDVNNFKHVNDSHGHAEGDKVLRGIATAMRQALRAHEFVGRIGGDEFAVVLSPVQSASEGENAARRLYDAADAMPLSSDGISLGIGIALFPDHATSAEEWLHRADLAMYRAKRMRMPYCTYDPDFDAERGLARVAPASERAYEQQFIVCFQPIFDVATGSVTAAEALVRWVHPKDGVLSAASALDSIEGNQLGLDVWVARKALEYADAWKRHGVERVHVNMTHYDDSTYRMLLDTLTAHSLSADPLALELPPSAINDRETFARFAASMSSAGARVGLDDFAHGPLDLAAMEQIPLAFVKLSRHLLPSAGLSGRSLEAVVAVSRIMGWDVIATRVASSDDRRAIRAAGVKFMQGFAYAQPMTAVDFRQWVESSPSALVG